jgi:predicted XRE-type DNA-binding protein
MPNIAYRPRLVTPDGRSISYDLFRTEKAAEIEMCAQLLTGLEQWLEKSRMMQAEAAKALGVTQARVSDRTLPAGTCTTSEYRVRSFGWMPS